MSHKMITVFCALVLVVGLSFAAQAEVQNIKVGGDIEIKGIYQRAYDVYSDVEILGVTIYDNENAALNFGGNRSKAEDYLMSTVRLYVDASLTDNVDAMVRLLNERDWDTIAGTGNVTQTEVDLAYLTLNEMYGYPFSLTFGRQELLYGEGFLVGDGVFDTADTYQYGARKSFDAIKAVWTYEPHQVDLFTAKINDGYFNNTDNDLYGLDWNIDGGMYGLWDVALFMTEQNPDAVGRNQTWALSVRGEGDVPQITTGTLALKGEIVRQWGTVDAVTADAMTTGAPDNDQERRDAWGGYVEGEYTFDNPYVPYFGLGYIYMSGNDVDSDEIEQFNPMFEDERYGEIAEVVYGAGSGLWAGGMTGTTAITNARIWKLGAGFKPTESTLIDLTYYNLRADEEVWSMFTADPEDQDQAIGDEFDFTVTYDYSEDVTFGLLYAVFNPGDFFEMGADEAPNAWNVSVDLDRASELIGSVKVTF